MSTLVLQVDANHPEPAPIAQAAEFLRAGRLVAFPTETVYGLGANALNANAVAGIFRAKGRPATNPVIVHVPDFAAALPLVADVPTLAKRLAERFWPGPLTLVVPKSPRVPDIVTAGGPTVALRAPAHPVALALLRASGLPLAAPSANRSTQLSPTTAEHVLLGLDRLVDLVLDAGPAPGGVESTVLDVTVDPPRLLRPGMITPAQLEAVVGPIVQTTLNTPGPARSPGLQDRHYAPRTPLEVAIEGRKRVEVLRTQRRRVGWLTWKERATESDVVVERLPAEPKDYAAGLYAALHRLDRAGVDRIVVDLPPEGDEWLAVHDRLRRAATG